MLWEYQFVPLDKIGNQLVILGAGLMNHDVLAELERIGACKICQYIGTWNDIKAAIDRLYKDRPKPAEQLTSVGQMLLQEGARAPQATPGGEAALAAPKEVLATPEMARSMAGGAGPAAPPVPARAASPPPSEPVSEPVTAAAAPLPLVAPPPPPAPVTAAGGESAPAPPASRFGSGRLSAFARPAAAAKPAPEAAAEAEKKAEPEGQDEKKKEPAARAPKAPKGGLIKFLKT
jgi:hypothetical protein